MPGQPVHDVPAAKTAYAIGGFPCLSFPALELLARLRAGQRCCMSTIAMLSERGPDGQVPD